MHDELRDLCIDSRRGRGGDGRHRARGLVVVGNFGPSSRPGQPFKTTAHLRLDVRECPRLTAGYRPSAAPARPTAAVG
jgi:hypothetical protein